MNNNGKTRRIASVLAALYTAAVLLGGNVCAEASGEEYSAEVIQQYLGDRDSEGLLKAITAASEDIVHSTIRDYGGLFSDYKVSKLYPYYDLDSGSTFTNTFVVLVSKAGSLCGIINITAYPDGTLISEGNVEPYPEGTFPEISEALNSDKIMVFGRSSGYPLVYFGGKFYVTDPDAKPTSMNFTKSLNILPFVSVGENWVEIDGKKYYKKSNGAFVTGSRTIGDLRFRFDKDGALVGLYTGRTKDSNGRRYWKNGVLQTDRWISFKNGNTYYVGKDGYARTGWAAVTRGEGYYSYFDKNGVWDGKTYYVGYAPETLRQFLLDFDLLSENHLYYALGNHSDKSKKEFPAFELIREIIEMDIDTPFSYDIKENDSETELTGDIYHGGKKIIIGVRGTVAKDLEFTRDMSGASYLYSSYFGFGLKLSDNSAYSRIYDALVNS